jgi:hypothetical protein
MKVRKVHFDNAVKSECRRELLKRPDIPVCVRRTGNTIHTDFRPIKPVKPVNPPTPNPPTPNPPNPPNPPTPNPPKPNPPTPNPPTPTPNPPTPNPATPSGTNTGAIIGGVLGTAGALGVVGAGVRAGMSSSPAFPEITDPAVANMELGDAPIMAEEATQGFTTGFQSASQAGLTSRAGAQTAVEEIEMANMTPETTPYDIFNTPANPASSSTAGEYIGEMNMNAAGELETTMYATPEIIPAAEMTSFEIGGEAVAVAGAESVATGVGAGLLAGAGAVAMGAVATVGALGYFAANGLFDFNAQANAYQKGDYNIAQEVATLQPPKLKYVMPDFNSSDPNSVMAYLHEKDQAQADYQQALADYNVALSKQQPVSSQVP